MDELYREESAAVRKPERFMNPDIVNNHRAISESAGRFLEYAVLEDRCLKRVDLLDDSLPDFLKNYPYPLHSWPWFIGLKMQRMLEECACGVPELIYRAIRKEFTGDIQGFMAFYEMPEFLATLFLDDGLKLSQMMLRMDAVLTASGLKILEVNAGPDTGGWQIQWMDRIYRKQSALASFFETNDCCSKNIPYNYIKHLIQQGFVCGPDQDGSINVLFITDGAKLTEGLRETLLAMFHEVLQESGQKGALFFEADFDAVAFKPAGVYLRGKKLSSLVSIRYETDIVLPLDIYRAYLRGQVFWPDNPFFPVIGDKRSLAILHKHRQSTLFNDMEHKRINTFVPWSATVGPQAMEFRGITQPMRELLLQHRESLVIKAARGAQGKDVFVGKFQSDEAWQEIVNRTLAESTWLAQEYCESLPFYGQAGDEGYGVHDVIWGIFGFGASYGGCWLRLMLKDTGNGIINSAKGAQETIVYEVHD